MGGAGGVEGVGGRETITRDKLLERGRSGRPWEFLPIAVQALGQLPGDAALRFLTAANFARLGLATAAREQLAELPDELTGEPDVNTLAHAIGKLPRDRVPQARLLATCRGNVEALAARGVDLEAELEAWLGRVETVELFNAIDGNVARRVRAKGGAVTWTALSDQVGAADQFARKQLVASDGVLFRTPYVLEGVDPPWLLCKLLEHTPPTKLGHQPRIAVLQADPAELLDGLALADLRAVIEDPRVSFFVGADAAGRLEQHLESRFEQDILGELIQLPTVRTRIQPPVTEILRAVQARQRAAADEKSRRVRLAYADRDRAWWARRYDEALGDAGPPLRVLIPTTRYSTYIQHASRDLAEAFREAGCEAELVIESDHFTKFCSIEYLSRLEGFRPDLVVLINYTRANAGGMFPPQLPFVCWIQDTMWQQLDAGIGGGLGDLDFLAGHLHTDLFEHFGYPRRNALLMPIVVSARKFHDGPVEESLLDRHACEIAYVGHQSETPDDQYSRVLRELAGQPALRRCVEAMYPRIREVATDPVRWVTSLDLAPLADETLRDVTGTSDPKAAARLLYLWVLPLADRILRHQSLEWAAEVARRRGWRMRVYGRGWERHPRLAPFACGELAHGEELRALYRAATVHLNLTMHTIRHQRLFECVLSGGLPLSRRKRSDLSTIETYTKSRIVRECRPVACELESRHLGYGVADHPQTMALAAVQQRYGVPAGPFQWVAADDAERLWAGEPPPLDREDAWLLGDPAEITFESPEALERLVERALQRPAWRRSISIAIARRVRDRFTTDRFVHRLIDMVRGALP